MLRPVSILSPWNEVPSPRSASLALAERIQLCWLYSQLCRCAVSGTEGQQCPGVLSEDRAALPALSEGSVHQGYGGTLHRGAEAGEGAL